MRYRLFLSFLLAVSATAEKEEVGNDKKDDKNSDDDALMKLAEALGLNPGQLEDQLGTGSGGAKPKVGHDFLRSGGNDMNENGREQFEQIPET